MATITWTVTNSVDVDDYDLESALAMIKERLAAGDLPDDAVHVAVDDLVSGWDDDLFYSLTEDVEKQVEKLVREYAATDAKVAKLLKKKGR
jgi:hypothetical protein